MKNHGQTHEDDEVGMKRSELGSQRRHTNALIISLLIGATMCVVVPVQLFAGDPATDAPQVPPSEGQTTMTPEQPAAPSTSDDAIETRGGINPLVLGPFSSDLSIRATYSGYTDYYPPNLLGQSGGVAGKGVLLGMEVKNTGKDIAYDVRAVIIGIGLAGSTYAPPVDKNDQHCRAFLIQPGGYPAMMCTVPSLAANQQVKFYIRVFSGLDINYVVNTPSYRNALNNLVQVMSATADPNLNNNWSALYNQQLTLYPGDAATNVNLATDLAVAMKGSADSANELQTYQITVSNRGRSPIRAVAFTHAFSQALPGTTIVKLSGDGEAGCASRDAVLGLPIVSCMVTELKAGTTAGATIIYRNPGNVVRTSTAQTIGANADLNPANNAATITVPEFARAPLEQQKVATQPSTAPSVTAPSATPPPPPTATTPPPLTMTPLAPSAALGLLKPAPLQIQPQTTVPSTPTMPTPATGKYRVVINGLRVIHETKDDMLQFDGKRDEVYVAAFVRRQSVPYLGTDFVTTTSQLLDHGFVRSKVHGDINGFQDHRVLAGTASELGGLRTSDTIPLNHDPALPSARPPSTTTFPLHVWEGTLNDTDALVIHPTLWEWDGLTGVYNHWSVEMGNKYVGQEVVKKATSNPLYTEYGQYIPYLPVGTPLLGGQGRPLLIDNISGHDHPIGMAAQGNGRFTVPDQFIVLTRAKLEALFASPSVIGGVPPVVIPVQFVDYGDGLEGNYTMYLRVEKVP